MSDPVTNLQNDLTVVAVIVLIGAAAFGAGYMTHALMAKTKAATAQVAAVTHAVKVADTAERTIITTQDKAGQAAEEAHHALAAVPKPAPSKACDYGPVMSAWRSGLERVRAAGDAGPGDDPAGRANPVPGTGPVGGQDAGGPG